MKPNNRLKARGFFPALAFFASLGWTAQVSAQEQIAYLIDLDTRTATSLGKVFPTAINDSGQVVGSYAAVSGQHAFLTGPDGAGMTDLGTLGGSSSRAFGINAAGQVVGESETVGGAMHAFITGPDGMSMRDLGTLGGISSRARAINDTGQVTGSIVEQATIFPVSFVGRAFITGPDGTDISKIGEYPPIPWPWAEPQDINAAGQVAGFAGDPPLRAFISDPDGEGMRDLRALGGTSWIEAYGINDSGQVTGFSITENGDLHAFITGPNGMGVRDLGALGGSDSFAYGINDAGQVVGDFHTEDGNSHAFVTDADGKNMTDLDSLIDLPTGYRLTRAVDINNNGQVLVTATIPEPETYAFLLAGLVLTGFMARRKKAQNLAEYY